jgi:hypothetical protein
MFSMCMASEFVILLGALKDLAIAAAAVVTAVVAVLGLRRWSDELR